MADFDVVVFDLDGADGGAGEGGEQDAAEGVPDRDAESALKRLDDEFAVMLVLIVYFDFDGDGFKRVGEAKLLIVFGIGHYFDFLLNGSIV